MRFFPLLVYYSGREKWLLFQYRAEHHGFDSQDFRGDRQALGLNVLATQPCDTRVRR